MRKGSGKIRARASVLLCFTIAFLLIGIHISLKLLSGDVEQVRISCLYFWSSYLKGKGTFESLVVIIYMETFLESNWLRVNSVQKRGNLMQK